MIVVIPMAGRGSRFSNEGYSTPKPLIEVDGKPMIYHAYRSIEKVAFRKLIFIALREHEAEYQVSEVLKKHIPVEFELILIDEVTEGQLCTVLLSSSYFQSGEGLLIAASDSYIKSDIHSEILSNKLDGIISVCNLEGSRWSFAKTNEAGNVIEVAEKVRISDHASTGIYYFTDSLLFEKEAIKMIEDKETTKGEYYIMPLYNKLIQKGLNIGLSHASEMWDMGTPEAKDLFEKHLRESNI